MWLYAFTKVMLFFHLRLYLLQIPNRVLGTFLLFLNSPDLNWLFEMKTDQSKNPALVNVFLLFINFHYMFSLYIFLFALCIKQVGKESSFVAESKQANLDVLFYFAGWKIISNTSLFSFRNAHMLLSSYITLRDNIHSMGRIY